MKTAGVGIFLMVVGVALWLRNGAIEPQHGIQVDATPVATEDVLYRQYTSMDIEFIKAEQDALDCCQLVSLAESGVDLSSLNVNYENCSPYGFPAHSVVNN